MSRFPGRYLTIELTDVCKRKATPVEESEESAEEEPEEEPESEEEPPPKKKAKVPATKPVKKTIPQKTTAKKISPQKNLSSPLVTSSDDDVPLVPPDAKIKSEIKSFLNGKDLSTVTKGMIKEMLRKKYGEGVVKTKKAAIAEGIEEGMQ